MTKDLLKAVYSADFTPGCTTELIAFSEIYDELEKRNTELLGLNVDSASSHIAWIRNFEEKKGVKIFFPIIADSKVSKEFGMIHMQEVKPKRFVAYS